MIEKVNAFPMEELYYLESQDFLVDRESVYLKKNKTMKLNSYWLGVSKISVNNDRLLYLFNGLRGYYDVRSRYIKEPKVFERRVPFSKKILVNEYFMNKYKYSDMLIFSLNHLNRPTITIKKEEGEMHYSFPSRLVEYINKKRELVNAVAVNKEFYKDIRQIRNIGFRFYLNPRRKNKGFRKIQFLNSIALGMTENYLKRYHHYIQEKSRKIQKIVNIKEIVYKKRRRRRKRRFNSLFKKKFYKTPNYIRMIFVIAKKYFKGKKFKMKKKIKIVGTKKIKTKKKIKRKKRIYGKINRFVFPRKKKNLVVTKFKK